MAAQNQRSRSDPLMGMGLQLQGNNSLINKSTKLGALASKKEQTTPMNMKQLLAEQRRKFLE